MKSNKNIIQILTGLISIALAGLIILQLYFLKNAKEQKEQAFDRNVLLVLNNTAQSLENKEAVEGIIQSAVINPKDLLLNDERLKNGPYKYNSFLQMTEMLKKYASVIQKKEYKEMPEIINLYKYSSDSSAYFIQSFNGNRIGVMLNDLSENKKKGLIIRVIDKLIMDGKFPLERRIRLSKIDSLLKSSLKDVGITIPYSFAVIDEKKDTVRMSYKGINKAELINSKLRARLYPNDLISPVTHLSISFPGRENMILKELSSLLLLSLIFIIIIAGGFIYSIRTIYRQKLFFTQIVDFINNMTHEFKTPISTISLASEALSNLAVIEDKSRLIRYNQVIKDENDRMRQQVEKILQMAVLEKGDYALDLRDIDLNNIINQAVHYLQLQVEAAGGKVYCTLNASYHTILADQVHITNIIHNILDNARKYSPEKPEILISTENKNSSIFIKITDNGIGITEENLSRVFEKYYRVPTGDQHDIKGFGLGLSYVELMVKAHSGKIEIKSKSGKGTTVIIELPVIIPDTTIL